MGCGCGAKAARRPVRSMVKSPNKGVLSAVANAATQPAAAIDEAQTISEERRKVEKLRRDAILRALGRP
jgi:hypothetical protein